MRTDARFATAVSLFFVASFLLLSPTPAAAQPFGGWVTLNGTNSHASVAHSPLLNPATAITLEGWTTVSSTGGCRSLVGKDWMAAYWVGVCDGKLRSYVNGASTARDGGDLFAGDWFHWAVTFDGTTRRHYVNGEETLAVAESLPLGQSTAAFRIGSDVQWEFAPNGAMDEVRVWNVARTKAQIRSTINVPITAPQAGLVAVFHFDGAGVGGFPVSLEGGAGVLTLPVGGFCTPSATALCFHGGRYQVTVNWMTSDGTRGTGKVVAGATSDSGIFWFFAPTNWELLVKVLNACSFSEYYWAFSAATTNVHYELTVVDYQRPAIKRYFNYQGENAPALNDTSAFRACP